MFTLFPDESIVVTSDGNRLILTTHRISYEVKGWSSSYNQSIMLEHITSCENHSASKPLFLVVSGVFALIGFNIMNRESNGAVVCWGIALAFAYLFKRSRNNTIVVGSPSTKMVIPVTGMKTESVLSFINKIEQTKHSRLLSLRNRD